MAKVKPEGKETGIGFLETTPPQAEQSRATKKKPCVARILPDPFPPQHSPRDLPWEGPKTQRP
ncbi:MAG: hypothetical protein PHZ04_05385 [Patescibacteria group bacterium]|nr:hypothetical protein [Patescibacteria group bacterium]